MSVWDKVYKNPKSKGANALGPTSLTVPDIKVHKRGFHLPSLYMGLSIGSTFTKRTFLCQLGTEVIRWNPENDQDGKSDLSVFRVEKVVSDYNQEISTGEEALSNFMSDRGDPSCTLFLQPIRFLLSGTKLPSFVTTYDGQKILHQSPSSKEMYKYYIKSQFQYLWDKAHSFYSEIRRFQIGQIVVEYPDYYSAPDVKKYRNWFVEAAEEFFPPLLSDEEDGIDLADRFTFVPESLVTLVHWLTDNVEPKLAAQEIDLKKLLVHHGILPRTTDPINFLVVSMGATHSRVVKMKASSIAHLASAKRVGETTTVAHSYLGRTGFGGDHISCAFLEEEEERRYGATPTHKVSTLTRKVFEDWGRMSHPEGKKHFEDLYGEQFQKAMEKLGELTLKGFSESPENTVIVLGGKVFSIPYFRDSFKDYLNKQRVPHARIVTPSSEDIGIERACDVIQFHQKGLGRSFTLRSGLETEGIQRFTWKIGKVVEGTLVDTILSADSKEWGEGHPRDFSVTFERGVRRLNLGFQKSSGGISQLWANVNLKTRASSPIQVKFRTEGPDDLRILEVKDDKKKITAEDFQVDMLISGEHPSHFPLYDKILKTG